MKKEADNNIKIDEGKKSLGEMLKKIKPFLPECDLTMPKPADDWKIAETANIGHCDKLSATGTYLF